MKPHRFGQGLLLAASLACADWRDGLEVAWNLDGKWTADSLGLVQGGIVSVNVSFNKGLDSTTNRFGTQGKAAGLKAGMGYVRLPDHFIDRGPLGRSGTQNPVPRTLSLWFKTPYNSQATALGLLGTSNVLPEDNAWAKAWCPVLYVGGDGLLRARFIHTAHNRTQSDADMLNSTVRVDDNTWHQAVLTVRDSLQELWLDGVKIESMTTGALSRITWDDAPNSDQVYSTLGVTFLDYSQAGSGLPSGQPAFVYGKGAIDDFRSWSRVLTDYEIRSLHAAEAGLAAPEASPLRGVDDTIEIQETASPLPTFQLAAVNDASLPLTWNFLSPSPMASRLASDGTWQPPIATLDHETTRGWVDSLLVTDGVQLDTVLLTVVVTDLDEPPVPQAESLYVVSASHVAGDLLVRLTWIDLDSPSVVEDGSLRVVTGVREVGTQSWDSPDLPFALDSGNLVANTSLAALAGRTYEVLVNAYSAINTTRTTTILRVAVEASNALSRPAQTGLFTAPTDGTLRLVGADGRSRRAWNLSAGQSFELPRAEISGFSSRLVWIPATGGRAVPMR